MPTAQVKEPIMPVKEAIKRAKDWLRSALEDESITNIGLEEIEFDPHEHAWKITLGFSRPWNTVKNALTAISGEPATRRAYRVITVDDHSGDVRSMKRSDED